MKLFKEFWDGLTAFGVLIYLAIAGLGVLMFMWGMSGTFLSSLGWIVLAALLFAFYKDLTGDPSEDEPGADEVVVAKKPEKAKEFEGLDDEADETDVRNQSARGKHRGSPDTNSTDFGPDF